MTEIGKKNLTQSLIKKIGCSLWFDENNVAENLLYTLIRAKYDSTLFNGSAKQLGELYSLHTGRPELHADEVFEQLKEFAELGILVLIQESSDQKKRISPTEEFFETCFQHRSRYYGFTLNRFGRDEREDVFPGTFLYTAEKDGKNSEDIRRSLQSASLTQHVRDGVSCDIVAKVISALAFRNYQTEQSLCNVIFGDEVYSKNQQPAVENALEYLIKIGLVKSGENQSKNTRHRNSFFLYQNAIDYMVNLSNPPLVKHEEYRMINDTIVIKGTRFDYKTAKMLYDMAKIILMERPERDFITQPDELTFNGITLLGTDIQKFIAEWDSREMK